MSTPPHHHQGADNNELIGFLRARNSQAFNAARAASGYAAVDISDWDGAVVVNQAEKNQAFIQSLRLQDSNPESLFACIKQAIPNLAKEDIEQRLPEHYLYPINMDTYDTAFLADIDWRNVTLPVHFFKTTHKLGAPLFNTYREANPDDSINMAWVNDVKLQHRNRFYERYEACANLKGYNLTGLDLTGIETIVPALEGCSLNDLRGANISRQQAIDLLEEDIFSRQEITDYFAVDGKPSRMGSGEKDRDWKEFRAKGQPITPEFFIDQRIEREGKLTVLWPKDAALEADLNRFQQSMGVEYFSSNKDWQNVSIHGLDFTVMEDISDNAAVRKYIADSGFTVHATMEAAAAALEAKARGPQQPPAPIISAAGSLLKTELKVREK